MMQTCFKADIQLVKPLRLQNNAVKRSCLDPIIEAV